MRVRPCVICGTRRKGMHFWLCKPCAVKWGCYKTPYSGWPKWIKALVQIADKQRKQRIKYGEPISVDPVTLERMIDNNTSNGSALP